MNHGIKNVIKDLNYARIYIGHSQTLPQWQAKRKAAIATWAD